VEADQRRPKDIAPNEKNWRLHPQAQRSALQRSLDEVGIVDSVLVNKRTGKLVDGHLRREVALDRGESLEVVEVDMDSRQEAMAILVTDGFLSAIHEAAEAPFELPDSVSGGESDGGSSFRPDPSDSIAGFDAAPIIGVRLGAFKFSVTESDWAHWLSEMRLEMGSEMATPEDCGRFSARRIGLISAGEEPNA